MIPLRSTFLHSIPVAFREPSRIPYGYVGEILSDILMRQKGNKIKIPDFAAIALNSDVRSEKSDVNFFLPCGINDSRSG